MSFSIDANVLLYASDASSPFHVGARQFLAEKTTGSEVFYLAWPTAFSYLRISTHPRVFDAPLSPAEALSNLKHLLSMPRVRMLSEADGFLDVYSRVTSSFPVRGNLVPDAHLASILLQHGVRTLYTNDADFKKFDFLKVRNPFASG